MQAFITKKTIKSSNTRLQPKGSITYLHPETLSCTYRITSLISNRIQKEEDQFRINFYLYEIIRRDRERYKTTHPKDIL